MCLEAAWISPTRHALTRPEMLPLNLTKQLTCFLTAGLVVIVVSPEPSKPNNLPEDEAYADLDTRCVSRGLARQRLTIHHAMSSRCEKGDTKCWIPCVRRLRRVSPNSHKTLSLAIEHNPSMSSDCKLVPIPADRNTFVVCRLVNDFSQWARRRKMTSIWLRELTQAISGRFILWSWECRADFGTNNVLGFFW